MLLYKFVAFAPELLLILSLPVLFLTNIWRDRKTPKTFYTIAKVFLIFAFLSTITFYNYSFDEKYFINTKYTTLFKIVIYIYAFAWFYLSLKWFLSKSKSSLSFYALGMLSVLSLSLVVSANNLWSLFAAMLINFIGNCFLIRLNDFDDEVPVIAKKYMFSGIFFMLIFGIGATFDLGLYRPIFIITPILFMLGLAPFHFWTSKVSSHSILPVSGFLSIIPIFAYFSALSNLTIKTFAISWLPLQECLVIFGIISVIIGALSTRNENNLRGFFAYSSLYHIGVIILCFSGFDNNSLLAAFVYLITHTLAMFGIYTVFYGFKIKGNYLTDISSVKGIAIASPYLSTSFLIFVISLIGMPPALGFLGRFSVMGSFLLHEQYWLMAVVLAGLLVLSSSYIRLIRVVCFDESKTKFDRIDKGVYIFLLINIILIIISIIKPKYLMYDADKYLATLF